MKAFLRHPTIPGGSMENTKEQPACIFQDAKIIGGTGPIRLKSDVNNYPSQD